VVQKGEVLTWLGQPEEGIDWIRKAMRLNPYHPLRFWGHLGRAYFVARRYAEALEALSHITTPDAATLALIAGCEALLGNAAAAAERMRDALKRDPGLRWEVYQTSLHYKRAEDLAHHRDSLVRAGLPQ
jgi:adenylate cyclase